jgi:hypothetical protein
MPQSYVPPIYGTSTPVYGNNTFFHLARNGDVDLRAGLRFFSIVEAGIFYSASSFNNTRLADNPYSGDYQTLWGGYAYGDYAAIGQVQVKNPPVGWYAQLQTPDINVTRHLALQPFVFVSELNDDVQFESGYHRYAVAFNPGYASADLGTITEIHVRVGLNLNWNINETWSVGLKGYVERDLGSFSATSQGEQFNTQYSAPHGWSPGGGLEIRFRF